VKIKITAEKHSFWLRHVGILISLSLAMALFYPGRARTSPIPGLTASITSNGFISLTVTNGVTNEFYTIYGKPALDTNFPWSGFTNGVMGQTNFLVPLDSAFGFYRAESGLDRDGDGIQNYQDADPYSSNVNYALTVIIESPTNGATIY
jgi:hypothetical protein